MTVYVGALRFCFFGFGCGVGCYLSLVSCVSVVLVFALGVACWLDFVCVLVGFGVRLFCSVLRLDCGGVVVVGLAISGFSGWYRCLFVCIGLLCCFVCVLFVLLWWRLVFGC